MSRQNMNGNRVICEPAVNATLHKQLLLHEARYCLLENITYFTFEPYLSLIVSDLLYKCQYVCLDDLSVVKIF